MTKHGIIIMIIRSSWMDVEGEGEGVPPRDAVEDEFTAALADEEAHLVAGD